MLIVWDLLDCRMRIIHRSFPGTFPSPKDPIDGDQYNFILCSYHGAISHTEGVKKNHFLEIIIDLLLEIYIHWLE